MSRRQDERVKPTARNGRGRPCSFSYRSLPATNRVYACALFVSPWHGDITDAISPHCVSLTIVSRPSNNPQRHARLTHAFRSPMAWSLSTDTDVAAKPRGAATDAISPRGAPQARYTTVSHQACRSPATPQLLPASPLHFVLQSCQFSGQSSQKPLPVLHARCKVATSQATAPALQSCQF